MGNLSMSRQQSALYGACLGGAGAAGVFVYRWPIRLPCRPLRRAVARLAAVTSIPPVSGKASKTPRFRLIRCVTRRSGHSSRTFTAAASPSSASAAGVQVINVFLGGTLHQDIPAHSGGCHGIRCTGALSALVGPAPTVNSYHHQAVDQPAPCLQTAARASDGIIEALMHATAPILGVQWHPERMVPPFCEDVAGANHLPLFHWLIERC